MSSNAEIRKRQHDRALEAARWLYETQKAELLEDPNRHRATISSTRIAAERFGVAKSTVARQLVNLKNPKPKPAAASRSIGRPSRLTDVEEQMLSFHIFMLRRGKRSVNRTVVQDAADALLSLRSPPGQPISPSWVRRWLQLDRAKRDAMVRTNGIPSTGQPVEAEADEADDDDDCSNEDALSDLEAAGLNPYPSVNEASPNLEPLLQWRANN
ncbi:hypothetical protein F5B22DRAFT_99278 [Xylaria bambusicola]|uniref:uncharacterized protein n=1 Tax=Xylaria bambusicola TaxID=326684 RepID=UPI00200854A0|nr:uncharacterized protein F5B22DRAFT_99278 [Xylaria bambusicola]KAI0517766.1 hypothetical protein F5B22DRAFT_99278 [Xylaria bambusicola]